MPHPSLFRKTYFPLNELTLLVKPNPCKVWKQMYWAVTYAWGAVIDTDCWSHGVGSSVFPSGEFIHSTQVRQSWESTAQIAFQENQCAECGWPTAPGSHFLGISHSIYTKSMLSLGHFQAMTKQGVRSWTSAHGRTPLLSKHCPGRAISLAQISSELRPTRASGLPFLPWQESELPVVWGSPHPLLFPFPLILHRCFPQ